MRQNKLSRNVILMGFTSFFTDVSSEMIYPLYQAFVSIILASKKALIGPILGIIEGIAESTASLLRVFSGYISDRFENRKLPTIAGYSTSVVAKFLLLLANFGWVFVLISRFLDRVGKGIRTAPRDALISESSSVHTQGRSFGFQRAMDFAGATLGTLIAFLLVRRFIDPITRNLKDIHSFYIIFVISIVPAMVAILFLLFIREKARTAKADLGKSQPKPSFRLRDYDRNLKWFFLSQLLMTLGNSTNQFLLLRSMNVGHLLSTVILMYLLFNLTTSLLSTLFGGLSDRIGRKKLLLLGYSLYAIIYTAFGIINKNINWLLWLFWPLYGLYYALTEGVEKAFIADIAPEKSKATALGFHQTIVGLGLLPASIIAGVLFAILPPLPFFFGGAMAGLSMLVLGIFVKEKKSDFRRNGEGEGIVT